MNSAPADRPGRVVSGGRGFSPPVRRHGKDRSAQQQQKNCKTRPHRTCTTHPDDSGSRRRPRAVFPETANYFLVTPHKPHGRVAFSRKSVGLGKGRKDDSKRRRGTMGSSPSFEACRKQQAPRQHPAGQRCNHRLKPPYPSADASSASQTVQSAVQPATRPRTKSQNSAATYERTCEWVPS